MSPLKWSILAGVLIFTIPTFGLEKETEVEPIDDMMACYAAKGRWFENEKMKGCRIKGKAIGVWSFFKNDRFGSRYVNAKVEMKDGEANGLHREFYPNARLRLEGQTVSGKENGTWKSYYEGGQLQFEIEWKDGKRNGSLRKWFANCVLAAKGSYIDDMQTGEWTIWHSNGRIREKGTYKADKKNGEWSNYHKKGPLLSQGPYVNDKKHGEWTEFLMNGVKWNTVLFTNDERQGTGPAACRVAGGDWTVDPESRTQGCTLKRQRIGEWTGVFNDGKLAWRGTYRNGQLDGPFTEYHSSGEILRQGQYVKGTPDGRHEFKSPDGQLYGWSHIVSGSGPWKAWYPDGSIREEGIYEDGAKSDPGRTTSIREQKTAGHMATWGSRRAHPCLV